MIIRRRAVKLGDTIQYYPVNDEFLRAANTNPDTIRWAVSIVDNANLYENGSGELVLQGWAGTGAGINSKYYYEGSSNWTWEIKMNSYGSNGVNIERQRIGISASSLIAEQIFEQWCPVQDEIMYTSVRNSTDPGTQINVQHMGGTTVSNVQLPATIQYKYLSGDLIISVRDNVEAETVLATYVSWAHPAEAHMTIRQGAANTLSRWESALDISDNAQGMPVIP